MESRISDGQKFWSILAIIVGVFAGQWFDQMHPKGMEVSRPQLRPGDEMMELEGPAGSFHDMVASADAILIGSIDSVVDAGLYEGYSGNTLLEVFTPTPSSGLGTPTPRPLAAIPFTDLLIDEEELIKDDEATDDWILRMAARAPMDTSYFCSHDFAIFPPGDIGERFMFFLTQNPDGTYGLQHGPFDRINLDHVGGAVTYSDCGENDILFTDDMNEEEFIDAIATEVAAQE